MVYGRQQSKTFRVCILVMCIYVVACLPALVVYVSIRISLQQRTAKGQGRIVSCQMELADYTDMSSGGAPEDQCRPIVHFTTESGQEIDFVSSYAWGGFQQGDEVSVQYAPDDAQDALIISEGIWGDVWLMIIYFGLPSIFLGICWGYASLRKQLLGGSQYQENI